MNDTPDLPNGPLGRQWDESYRNGKWEKLKDLQEVAHYAILAAWIGYLGANVSILDVGCGEGVMQTYLSQWQYDRYLGIDLSKEAIQRASMRIDAKTQFIVADGSTFKSHERFTSVVLSESLYYFPDPLALLDRYATDILAEGGMIFTSVFVPPGPYDNKYPEFLGELNDRFEIFERTSVVNTRGQWECAVLRKKLASRL